jgi:hypothetical protein
MPRESGGIQHCENDGCGSLTVLLDVLRDEVVDAQARRPRAAILVG